MKRIILVISLVLPGLHTFARSLPGINLVRDAFHDLQNQLAGVAETAAGCIVLVFLMLYFSERKTKKRVAAPSPPPVITLEPEQTKVPVSELVLERERETETETFPPTWTEASFDVDALQLNFPDSFFQPGNKQSLGGNFIWTISLPGKTDAQTGPFLLSIGSGGEDIGTGEEMRNYLKEGVKLELYSPELLLNYARGKERSFGKNISTIKIICCSFDLKGGWLRFASLGASLWLIRNGDWKEFPTGSEEKCTAQTLGLRKKDVILLFPALTSQLVEEELKQVLISNSFLPMKELNALLGEWLKRNPAFENAQLLGIRIT